MATYYGIDTAKAITPMMVRDAILRCFEQAHLLTARETLKNFSKDFTEDDIIKMAKANTEAVVRKAFKDTESDFWNPTKESLIKVIDYLAEFSQPYRKEEIIQTHYREIMELIAKLP